MEHSQILHDSLHSGDLKFGLTVSGLLFLYHSFSKTMTFLSSLQAHFGT